MTRLPSFSTSLWVGALVLLIFSASLWMWQEKIATQNASLQADTARLTACSGEKARKNAQCALKKETLTLMRQKGFTQKSPHSAFLQKELLALAKTHHMEKIRFEMGSTSCAKKLCKTPVTLYVQSALDTDVTAFMEDVHKKGPWTMTWEGVALFKTPQETVQGDLKGGFYVFEP